MKIWKKEHILDQVFDIKWLSTGKKDRRAQYANLPCTFDTEFTTVKYTNDEGLEHGKGLLYLWTACVFGECYEGRTVEEFRWMCMRLRERLGLNNKKRLVFYVHNLSADFPYIFPYFKWMDAFAANKRSVLKATTGDGFEFRCSYKLTNMSLKKFLELEGAPHQKQSGEKYDYKKLRTPDTDLTIFERYYAACDVLGLWEAIITKLFHDGDNICTVPMTSTGYVRRDCRDACRADKSYRLRFNDQKLTAHQYEMLLEAFRGGNTHANREFAGRILEDVWSFDISSSYPAAMLYEQYPCGPFYKVDAKDEDDLDDLIDQGYALLMTIRMKNVFTMDPIPYISMSKRVADFTACQFEKGWSYDNGRVLWEAGWTTMTVTDVDYEILADTYSYDDFEVVECYASQKGPLPLPIRQVISKYFEKKTRLKNVAGQEYYYTKSKNNLNGIYGMMVMALIRDEYSIDFLTGEWEELKATDVDKEDDDDKEKLHEKLMRKWEKGLSDYYKNRNSFLHYQWGVWVTAYARRRLQEAIEICGDRIVYCDTDSVKFLYDPKIIEQLEELNKKYQKMADECETTATALTEAGEVQTLGLWDKDAVYEKFITYGAKKYAYVKNGNFSFTVSGLGKAAKSELKSIEDFTLGRTIVNSGRTISEYDDDPRPHYIYVDGRKYEIRSNMAILDTTYTLGVTDEYLDLVDFLGQKYEATRIDGKRKLRFKSSAEWDPE